VEPVASSGVMVFIKAMAVVPCFIYFLDTRNRAGLTHIRSIGAIFF